LNLAHHLHAVPGELFRPKRQAQRFATLEAAMEKAQRTGEAPEIGRGLAQKLRFVRHEGDNTWHSLESPEGEKIVSQWAVPTKDGITPIVCTP